jgi:hypothetical protein
VTLDDLASVVATACSLTLHVDLFPSQMPAQAPDVCAALYEYPGLSPVYTLGDAAPALERPRVQLAFRGAPRDYEGPRATAELAYQALAATANTSLSGTRYLEVTPLQPPFLLRRDELSRPVIGFNVQISKELS